MIWFARWLPWWTSWISERNHFSNSKSPCCPDGFHQVSAPAPDELTIEELKDGCCGGHRGYGNKMALTILNLHVYPMPPPSFCSIRLTIRELMRFENFQDGHLGGHIRYRNRTTLAILNLYVAPMSPIKFGLNPHYSLGDVVWRTIRWLPWRPSWMTEWNEFSSSEYISPQWLPPRFSLIRHTVRGQVSFQDFQAGPHGSHLGYWNETNLTILNLHVAPMPPTKFGLNPTSFGSRCGLMSFNIAIVAAILVIRTERF